MKITVLKVLSEVARYASEIFNKNTFYYFVATGKDLHHREGMLSQHDIGVKLVQLANLLTHRSEQAVSSSRES